MKKLILTLVVILFSTNTLFAKQIKWTKIVTTEDRTTEFYLDKKSIRKVGEFHYFWMMSDYLILEEGDNPDTKSSITFNIINCKTNELKRVTMTTFTLNNVKGKISSDFIVPDLAWIFSNGDFILKKLLLVWFLKKCVKLIKTVKFCGFLFFN